MKQAFEFLSSWLVPYHVYDVGASYWGQKLVGKLFTSPDSMHMTIFSLGYMLVAWLMGIRLIGYFRGITITPRREEALWLLAGFMPGYLLMIALNRLMTIALPNALAWPALLLCYGGVLTTSLASLKHLRCHAVLVALPIACLFLILQIQSGGAGPIHVHVIGDAAGYYLNLIAHGEGFQPQTHLPIIPRHYDEILFLYPLAYYTLQQQLPPFLEWYWVLYGLGKASCFALSCLAIRSCTRSMPVAILISLLLFFGSLHPNPLGAYLLFDSANPLGNTLHIARAFIPIIPLVLIAMFLLPVPMLSLLTWKHHLLLVFLGMGIASLSIHATIAVLISCAIGVLMQQPARPYLYSLMIGVTILCMHLLYLAIQSFNIGDSSMLPFALSMLEILLLYGLWIHLPALGHLLRQHKKFTRHFKSMMMLCCGIAVGMLFLGNFWSMEIYHRLGFTDLTFLSAGTAPGPNFFAINPWCDAFPLQYCHSFTSFVSAYGLPFALVGVVGIAAMHLPHHQTAPLLPLYAAISCCLVTLMVMHFMIDGMNGDPYYAASVTFIWVKSRLAEPWFYSAIALSLALLWQRAHQRARWLLIMGLCAFLLPRHLLSEQAGIFGQFLTNLHYLLGFV